MTNANMWRNSTTLPHCRKLKPNIDCAQQLFSYCAKIREMVTCLRTELENPQSGVWSLVQFPVTYLAKNLEEIKMEDNSYEYLPQRERGQLKALIEQFKDDYKAVQMLVEKKEDPQRLQDLLDRKYNNANAIIGCFKNNMSSKIQGQVRVGDITKLWFDSEWLFLLWDKMWQTALAHDSVQENWYWDQMSHQQISMKQYINFQQHSNTSVPDIKLGELNQKYDGVRTSYDQLANDLKEHNVVGMKNHLKEGREFSLSIKTILSKLVGEALS